MIDKYYMAPTEADLFNALSEEMKRLNDNGEVVVIKFIPHVYEWDWGVSLYKSEENFDGDVEFTPVIKQDGFFENLRLLKEFNTDSIDKYEINVNTPSVKFS